jgi:hypothetical protein
MAFAKLKALLRAAAARTIPDLWQAIADALRRFTPQECANYLAAAGYDAIGAESVLNYPSATHGITIEVRLSAPPAIGKNILELALLNSQLILAFPRPSVHTQSIDALQTELEITFFVDRLDSDTDAQDELFDLISRHALAAGAQLAPPNNAPYQPRDDAER